MIYPTHSFFWCHSLPEWPWRPPSPLCSTIQRFLQLSLARGNWSLSLPPLPTYHSRVEEQEHKLTCLWRFGLFSTRACANIQGHAYRKKKSVEDKNNLYQSRSGSSYTCLYRARPPSTGSLAGSSPLQSLPDLLHGHEVGFTHTGFSNVNITFWPQQWLVFVSKEWMYPSSSWDVHCVTNPNPWD